ncbi:hypothetical protein C1H46_024211 [Malus baccata]|uniref:Uncharacterized protein n=1 Tax=Malus baccata TaxID=106549 RepID=A0A540LUK1_MALBA|nr:hypothetical protein C1H46_024211 [Malus baccata]
MTSCMVRDEPDLDVDVASNQPDLALGPSGSPPVSHAVFVTSSLPVNASAPSSSSNPFSSKSLGASLMLKGMLLTPWKKAMFSGLLARGSKFQ